MTPNYIDVAAVLRGDFKAPETTVGGRRSDNTALLYGSSVNVLLGDPEAGKTLVAGGMAADELFSGGRVLWIDLDHNGALPLLKRMVGFGVRGDLLSNRESFRLATPDDATEVTAIVEDRTWSPTLVVVDSLGELLPMFGANSNDADDYTRVHRAVLTRFANAGAAVLAIDHQAKGENSRTYGATGSAAKKRAVDGVLFRVTNTRPFAPGAGGEANLSVLKDRHGFLRSLGSGREPVVAVFSVDPVPGGNRYRFGVPAAPVLPSSDVELLAALTPPPSSVRDVKERMRWGSDRANAAFKAFQAVPGTPRNVPEPEAKAGVPPFLSPIGEERGTLAGNAA